MTGIDEIEKMIDEARKYERKREYFHAYQLYLETERIAEYDSDCISDSGSGMSPFAYDGAQAYASIKRYKIWNRLTEEEKKELNEANDGCEQ